MRDKNKKNINFAFERMLREMAVDREPMPKRLWASFYDCIVNEDIEKGLSDLERSALDHFTSHYIYTGMKFSELDQEACLEYTRNLDEFTAMSAFNDLMKIKDELQALLKGNRS